MRITLLLAAALLLLTGVSITACSSGSSLSSTVDSQSPGSYADSVELVYFHTGDACHCMAVVEENIRYAVDTYFSDEVANGTVKFTSIVSDDPANAELVKAYDALLFTLFIKETRGSNQRVYPVSDIWNMTGDDNRDKLVKFIRDMVVGIIGSRHA